VWVDILSHSMGNSGAVVLAHPREHLYSGESTLVSSMVQIGADSLRMDNNKTCYLTDAGLKAGS
jgi:hypothetical protein